MLEDRAPILAAVWTGQPNRIDIARAGKFPVPPRKKWDAAQLL